MKDDLKLKIYPAIIAILGLSLVALALSRVEIQVARTPRSPEPEAIPTPTPSASPEALPTPPQPASPQPAPLEASPTSPASPTPDASIQGGLRVSNQTSYPIRVALLYQQSATEPETAPASSFGQPVHWDFAPEEGAASGLIMSLPGAALRLRQGDVLVAFAQDGSRRYWGPYVVGKTQLPAWNSDQQEWLLPLR